ncbi:hypothetical protein [Flavobacterium sp. 7A]|nr:hypothetical protein [Flavobacterium sp. 7A]MCW2118571.1 hypothetical protein [Flavobacterium sp. 7A]
MNRNDFTFTTAEWESATFETEIKYKKQTLNPVKTDTKITHQSAFEVMSY